MQHSHSNPRESGQPLDIERLRKELMHLGEPGEPSDLDADLAHVNPKFLALFASRDFQKALREAIKKDIPAGAPASARSSSPA